jgi:hypothetical protein
MKESQSMRSPQRAVVRKYQVRWEFCLDGKMHSYHWLGMTA